MTENLTLEQKEKNKQYILENLGEYVVDIHGNFFHTNPEFLGNGENGAYAYIGSNALTPKGYQEIRKKMGEMILNNL